MEEQVDTEHLMELTVVVMRIIDEWGVEPHDQPTLLGLPLGTRPRALQRYRDGSTTLPSDRATLQRLSHLLAIDRAVQRAFPHHGAMGRYWVTTPHHVFGGQTPLQVMLVEGLEGIEQVVDCLNCSQAW
jgi:hypothetical protein